MMAAAAAVTAVSFRGARAAALAAALAGLMVAGLLSACSGPPAPGADYFPLEAGHRWVYDQTSEWENDSVEHEPLVLSTLGEQALPGGDSGGNHRKAWQRRSDGGVDYWLRSDSSGIYRIASKTNLDVEPTPDPAPRYVLKAPLAVGTSWQASTTTYLMRRNADFPPEIRHTHKPVAMQYRIAALDEAVTTRAGEFKHCLRVQGTATLRLFADPVNGLRDMPIDQTEWYCAGVGLVKLQRTEPAKSTFLTGGALTLELIEWQ